MKKDKLKFIITTSFIYAFAAIITVKVNKYIENKKEICHKNNKSDRFCHIYIDPYLPNSLTFLSTFFSTLILYFIIYYVLNIDY